MSHLRHVLTWSACARLSLALLALAAALPGRAAPAPLPPVISALAGPDTHSVIVEPPPADWHDFAQGSAGRLAILLAGDETGSWLELTEGLRALGVPVTVTRDWQEAVRHRMVIVYPRVSARVLSPLAQSGLRTLLNQGGVVVGFEILGGGVSKLFGVKSAVPSRGRFSLRFALGARSLREAEVPLGLADHPDLALGSYAYEPSGAGAGVVASFDTGEPAILDNPVGTGHAYAVGVDVGDLAARGFSNRQEWIGRSYVNQYEPAVDVMLHWLKDRYREAQPFAVTLSGTPDGKSLPVMITHDLDFLQSMRNALEYLAFEREAGIRATYFIQAKYVRDWEDEPFLDSSGVDVIHRIAAGGMEIGSHTVAHSRIFAKMPQGSGDERFPDYWPVIPSALACNGCSIFGELRISHFLLEQLSGQDQVSFRPGGLSDPVSLPESMAATGFTFGSSETANGVLSHLPIHTHFGRGRGAEVPVWEFPITIEDEEAPRLGDRVGAALAVAADVIRDEGIFVVLIHPNVVDHKLRFERELVAALRDRAWFGTVGEFGRWWRARDGVGVDLVPPDPSGGPAAIPGLRLHAPESIAGLTLQLPAGVCPVPGPLVRSCADGRAVLGRITGDIDLVLQRDP